MENLTLFKTLKSFTREEIDQFSDFIESPYFNKANYLKTYFSFIKVSYPEFKKEELEAEKIFRKIYPERKYNNATIRRLNYELFVLAEKFLIVNSLNNKKELGSELLLEELDMRRLDTHFLKKLRKGYSELESIFEKGEDYFRNIHRLNELEMYFHTMREREKGVDQFYTSLENFDKYHAVKKLIKLYLISMESNNVSNIVADKKSFNEFTKYITERNFFDLPLIEILYNMLMLSLYLKEEYFYKLTELVNKHKQVVPSKDLQHAYFMLLNFCTFEINKGTEKFKHEELGIYKKLIVDGQLLYNNELESQIYKNIVACAMDANDFPFAREFMDKYRNNILTDDKADIINFCEANYAFRTNNFEKALEILSKVRFVNVSYKLSLKVISLKLFFENNMTDQALAGIDSFKHLLKRESVVSENVKKLYYMFLKFYEKLIMCKIKMDKVSAGVLKESVSGSEVMSKVWILKELDKFLSNDKKFLKMH
ncbi:hypothetical protein BH10BAC5_BH10BAC5_03060 [soil metagenome]